ncbi:hypothetical protein FRC09_002229 [Ceratobasidium sp. 395]|nr:hypothetical protein FRC09_002229 [Ceratobasidium sp. 395]
MVMRSSGQAAIPKPDDENSGSFFHFGFDGSSFMFPSLRITSWPTFFVACFITIAICWSERYLTYLISTKWIPLKRRSPLAVSLWRSAMYWVVTLERLIYMLIAMTFHAGLILVIVTSLSIGQFFIELQEAKGSPDSSNESYHALRSSSEMENDSYADPPSSLFPFTPARGPQPDASKFDIRLPNRTRSPADSELLSPAYRPPPARAVAFEIPENTDVGSGNGRNRAREIMGLGR